MEMQDVFEEWTTYAMKKTLLLRNIDMHAMAKNSNSKIVAITGVRRSGKSSILMLIAQMLSSKGAKVCYINLEDSRIRSDPDLLDSAIKWFGDEGFMLLDEITGAVDWEGWLSRTHELLKGRLHIIVSSSRKTLTLPSKSLRGRILRYEIFPLSFTEFLRFKRIPMEKTTAGRGKLEKALNEYLKFGGFPEVVLTDNETDKVRIINSYFNDIIGLDVADLSGQESSVIDIFGKYILRSAYFSASKCLNFMKTLGYKIGKGKILELEKYSEASYLFFFMNIFSKNIKDRLQYPRKTYLVDTGFYYGIAGRTDYGILYENAVFLALRRMLQENHEIYYWKNVSGIECDFITRLGLKTHSAIQVAYDMSADEVRAREIRGLNVCKEELSPSKLVIITKDSIGEKGLGAKIMRLQLLDFLLQERGNW